MKSPLVLLAVLLSSMCIAQDKYEKIMADYFSQDGTAGSAIVAKGDKVLYRGAVGMANLELGLKAKPEHIFRLGSITKQFTATAILMLQEQGELNVKDPIIEYLPEYPVGDHEITIEHLLNHTSGIQSYTDMPGFMESDTRTDMTVDELIDVFKDEPMNFNPGDAWAYNNSGYILLGKIIEVVSDMTYEDFIEEKIFARLDMSSSYYDNNSEVVANRIPGYMPDATGAVRNANYISMTLPYAAGSLMSTVDDLLKWNTAVMSGALVEQETLASAFSSTTLNDGSEQNYGYGWSLSQLGGKKVIEHGGGIFGFLTQGMFIPEEDVYVAVLSNCNCISPNAAALRLAALAIGSPLEFKPVKVDESELQQYVGVYAIEGTDELRTISIQNGELMSKRGEGAMFKITPYDDDKFYYESLTTIEFNRDADGAVKGHTVTTTSGNAGYAELTDMEVAAVEIVNVDLEVLELYTGEYELMPNFNITVSINGTALRAQATGQGAFDLEARSDTKFAFPPAGIIMEFPENLDGKSPEFKLIQGGQTMVAKRVND